MPQQPLDAEAKRLALAIRNRESGGNYTAKGKSGEWGAYQYTQPTWKAWAGKHLGDPNADLTPENQNQVAYKQIKEWKDQGYKPDQIASMWNSGKPDYQGNVGVNKFGVNYDTPKYVEGVKQEYMKLKGTQQQPQSQPQNSMVQTAYATETPAEPQKTKMEKVGGFLDTVFGGGKIGEAIGTQIAKGNLGTGLQKFATGRDLSEEEEALVSEGPTKGQIGADIARTAVNFLPVGRATGALTSRLAQEGMRRGTRAVADTAIGAGAGYAYDVTEKARQGEDDIFKPGIGTYTGGALGLATAGVGSGIRRLASQTGQGKLESLSKTLSSVQKVVDRNTKYDTVNGKRVVRSNPLMTLKNENLLPAVVDGKIDSTAIREQVRQRLQEASELTRQTIASSGKVVPFTQFRDAIRKKIKGDSTLKGLGKTETTLKAVDRVLASYKNSYGKKIPVTSIDEIREAVNREWNPDTRDMYRAIGDAARDIVYDVVPDKKVRDLLRKEGELLGADDFLEVLHGKAVKGGRLGAYISQILGAIAGGSVGTVLNPVIGGGVGAVAGGIAAGKIAKGIQSQYFKTPLANTARRLIDATSDVPFTPGDAFLKTQTGQNLEKSLINSAKNPSIGLATRVTSNLTQDQKDDILRQLHNLDVKQLEQSAPLGGAQVDMETFARLDELRALSDKRPLTEREFAELAKLFGVSTQTKQPLNTRFIQKNGKMQGSKPKPIQPYKNEGDLSTKLLGKLEGKTTVMKQYISDLTNSPDLKQAERDLIRKLLEKEPLSVNVPKFAEKVKKQLLTLERGSLTKDMYGSGPRYESINLPDELRGPVANYDEHIYKSPVKTSAGQVHFNGQGADNYFAHSRIEDLPTNQKLPADLIKQMNDPDFKSAQKAARKADDFNSKGTTRRVIEIQSDLFQKGRLEAENPSQRGIYNLEGTANYEARKAEINKLEPYRNTWHERLIREEVKKAAQDGKTKLQFPTGETAMKIEGLGQGTGNWRVLNPKYGDSYRDPLSIENMKIGESIQGDQGEWIITDVLGDGKFKATPRNAIENGDLSFGEGFAGPDDAMEALLSELKNSRNGIEGTSFSGTDIDLLQETFDISGKVDTNNPIYKFYEKEVGKYLKNKFNAQLVTDERGVTWWEVPVDKKIGKLPVEAFAAAPILLSRPNEEE